MTLLHITTAKYIGDYKRQLSFDNGYSGVADLKEKIYNDPSKNF